MKTPVTIILGVAILLSGTAFSLFSSSGAPKPQPAHRPGTLVLKKELVFAGYATPEATLESFFWSMVNANYEGATGSVLESQAREAIGRNAKQFEEARQEFSDLKSLQIFARKDIDDNQVELRFETLDKDDDGTDDNSGIARLMKVGVEWKLDANALSDYKTNWDDGKVTQYGHRELAPPKPGTFKLRYAPVSGISISKINLNDAGDDTPEHALETYYWAWAHTNYDRMTGLMLNDSRMPAVIRDPAVRRDMDKFGFPYLAIHINAKKVIADDRVELLTGMEQEGFGSEPGVALAKQERFVTFPIYIQQMIRTNDGWKIGGMNVGLNSTTNLEKWQDGSEPEPTVKR